MDYDKIGAFIAERRRSLELTQKDLADTLNITDRAVSRWERGKGCPDISLLEPLANKLEISVLELLRGEEIKEEENEAIVDILKHNKKNMRKWKFISFSFLNLLLFFLGIILFCDFLIPNILKNSKNLTIYISQGGAMEPYLNYGDQVYFKNVDIDDIKVGDIVLVKYLGCDYEESNFGFSGIPAKIEKVDSCEPTEELVYASRVFQSLESENGERQLKLKGDRNMTVDWRLAKEENLVGLMKFKIPIVGAFYTYDFEKESYIFSSKWLFFIVFGIVCIVLLDVIYLRRHLTGRTN